MSCDIRGPTDTASSTCVLLRPWAARPGSQPRDHRRRHRPRDSPAVPYTSRGSSCLPRPTDFLGYERNPNRMDPRMSTPATIDFLVSSRDATTTEQRPDPGRNVATPRRASLPCGACLRPSVGAPREDHGCRVRRGGDRRRAGIRGDRGVTRLPAEGTDGAVAAVPGAPNGPTRQFRSSSTSTSWCRTSTRPRPSCWRWAHASLITSRERASGGGSSLIPLGIPSARSWTKRASRRSSEHLLKPGSVPAQVAAGLPRPALWNGAPEGSRATSTGPRCSCGHVRQGLVPAPPDPHPHTSLSCRTVT